MGGLFLNSEDVQMVINDQTFIALVVIGALVILVAIVVALAVWANKFQQELKRVNSRIEQSLSERERQHYIRRRRRLFLSIIPFVKYKR